MKIQNSKSKIQKNSKDQNSNLASGRYPLAEEGSAWVLNETADDNNNNQKHHVFDLEERTARFGEAIIRLCRKTPKNSTTNRLIDQLVGCGTSVGANYCEASEKVSQKDFKLSIGCCSKEAKESRFFLRMLAAAEPTLADEARELYREAKELHMIFVTIFRK